MIMPSFVLFWVSILFSILILISSPSLLMAWLALELNTLAFIPLLLSPSNFKSVDSALKYFLSQTLASIFFLLSILSTGLVDYFLGSLIILICALMLKLGAAPFHAWLPSMISQVSWGILFILFTIQKINPLLLISSMISYNVILIMIVGVTSLLLGAFMGLLQSQTRKMITYSSINQVGWFIMAMWSSEVLLFWAFLLYLIVLVPVVYMFKLFNISTLSQLCMKKMPLQPQALLFLSLLSLGGIPPLLGFLPKWFILADTVNLRSYLLAMIMIVSSLLTLFFYLRLSYNSFIMNSTHWNLNAYGVSFMASVTLQTTVLFLPLSFVI